MTGKAIGFALGLAVLCESLAAQTIRGRVVDATSRQGIADVSVIVQSTSGNRLQALTNKTGFFNVRVRSPGTYTATIEYVGFAREELEIIIAERDTTISAIVLSAEAVKLDSLQVDVRSAPRGTEVGFSRASAVISGERMARFERIGLKPVSAMGELSGVHLRSIGNRICVEATRRMAVISSSRRPQPGCAAVLLVIDDVPVGDPFDNARSLNIAEIESMEFLPPVEAGWRYGMDAGAVGAIVIWTRGRGPHKNRAREVK